MRFLVMANGEYGDMDWYRDKAGRFDRVICVDGGAARARELGVVPDWVVGDMDSISEDDLKYMESAGAVFHIHPPEKDYTDTQLALELAENEGANGVVIWGGTGSRLDHTMSNILSASSLLQKDINVFFDSPALTIYLIDSTLGFPGSPGDTVSLVVLGERAAGITLQGFKYPLNNAVLEGNWQWAVSNVITQPRPVVRIDSGVLAVFHYREFPL